MGRDQFAPEYLLLMQVAQTGKSHPGAQRVQPRQEAADRVRPADRHDHDPLRLEIPAAAYRGRFQCDLVADALDEHYGHGVVDLRQGAGRRPDRGGRATHVTIERPAGKITDIGDIHRGSRSGCDGRELPHVWSAIGWVDYWPRRPSIRSRNRST